MSHVADFFDFPLILFELVGGVTNEAEDSNLRFFDSVESNKLFVFGLISPFPFISELNPPLVNPLDREYKSSLGRMGVFCAGGSIVRECTDGRCSECTDGRCSSIVFYPLEVKISVKYFVIVCCNVTVIVVISYILTFSGMCV